MWEAFGDTILNELFKKSFLMHFFNGKSQKAEVAANYWKETKEFDLLLYLVEENGLRKEKEIDTVRAVMHWINTTYPSSEYYKKDEVELWNKPSITMNAWITGKRNVVRVSTDCDDYAIMAYSLCRVAGVLASNLRLCYMKTATEWHLNVMYLYNGKVPFAVEGTYYPSIAEQNFGKTPYMQLSYHKKYYYDAIKFIFNEDGVWFNKNYGKVM